ncbi:hypothetical protein ABIB35_002538 [Arthrobacter sp. UYP6]|uniref:hypothetical protein n=1 Tax=Arthrobacter sp. UYP6 TaxID=1756378 RepID=UPI0033926488
MSIQTWWARLAQETRDWLIANNGSAIPERIRDRIEQAGGPASGSVWWRSEEGTFGSFMPDAAIDWIEAAANDETPR